MEKKKEYSEIVVMTNGDVADQLADYIDEDYKLFDKFLERFGRSNISLSTSISFILVMFEESIIDFYGIEKKELNNIEPDILKTIKWTLELLREALIDDK